MIIVPSFIDPLALIDPNEFGFQILERFSFFTERRPGFVLATRHPPFSHTLRHTGPVHPKIR